ncbi:MAG TPA: formate C-acetyltransferase [Acholeplasmataceae bacterium]|jgi:formate C-acetyltransferase|nr:formate C-acetyltransferase [Acholeplasmataceae bacterium]
MFKEQWRGFKGENWKKQINVRDFMFDNYTEYKGDDSFLVGPTKRTTKLNDKFNALLLKELKNNGVIDMCTEVVSGITSHPAGYLDKDLELIVGLQTDKPLKRAFHPYGGIRVAVQAASSHGYEINPQLEEIFTKHRKTHNQGVFDVYTPEIRDARSSGLITGLPDAYGRGRVIGDYRRVALYGVNFLIEEKKKDKESIGFPMTEEKIRMREEHQDQIVALKELIELGKIYGYDISVPATNAIEAIQWTYFAYLASVKQQNGAAMSLGSTASFFDVYIERDIKEGVLDEEQAQELIDQFILKLRGVRFARTPEYDNLFTGDPTWVTESLAGMTNVPGKSWVTKTTFRYLQTLYNLGTSAEPNLTVLWSRDLPENFKKFCAKVSIDTSSIQYENDDLMRPKHSDDYAIACCVSPMGVGKETQFFGARANLAKALLYAINGGRDEMTGKQVSPKTEVMTGVLDYDTVVKAFDKVLDWTAQVYVNSLNIIHYMHDKYAYESLQFALHDLEIKRNMATGIAGLSVVADSLSAIKYAKVTAIQDPESGLVTGFETEGEFPFYGNNDDRVDSIAVELVERFMEKIRSNPTYRNSYHTMSVLTITSNVVYGLKTGATPDGRAAGQAFAPGANPMHGRDSEGALKSLLSVAKLPVDSCEDGISNTFTILPAALSGDQDDLYANSDDIQVDNLVSILNGYFDSNGYHLNVNVLNRERLIDAYQNPDKYPNLTIRVSGYAVNFSKLTDTQKLEVINRTFHERLA